MLVFRCVLQRRTFRAALIRIVGLPQSSAELARIGTNFILTSHTSLAHTASGSPWACCSKPFRFEFVTGWGGFGWLCAVEMVDLGV
eukprot:scaffold18792_cov30-Tisochrysis_lutea.AAC.1